MTVVLAMAVESPTPRRPTPCECPPERCRYRPALVKLYVIAYREAVKAREDPSDYIRDHVRNSREVDPWTRGGRLIDPQASIDIKLSLELARDRYGIALTAWNADRLSNVLCPERWCEGRDVTP